MRRSGRGRGTVPGRRADPVAGSRAVGSRAVGSRAVAAQHRQQLAQLVFHDLGRTGPDLLFGGVVFSVVILGEEIGWRGFLLPRLREVTSPRRAAVITGFLHGLFHVPLITLTTSYDSVGSPWLVAPIVVATITAAGVFYAWPWERSASIWPVAMVSTPRTAPVVSLSPWAQRARGRPTPTVASSTRQKIWPQKLPRVARLGWSRYVSHRMCRRDGGPGQGIDGASRPFRGGGRRSRELREDRWHHPA
ncbi:CPBP family intramembrane glutamic endopeptidase [Parafrankia sp. FMc2]|uniref:CPBP family intramembrane glutamic endopeptidase n=1 Tax=Parafrankia sp. FMc2 TaxID=3233196 RepID=UPI0034D50261